MSSPLNETRSIPSSSVLPSPSVPLPGRENLPEIAAVAVVALVTTGAVATVLRPEVPATPTVVVLALGLVVATVLGLRARLEVLALRREDARRRLERTRQQLTPHFLLNALNTVGALAADGDRGATTRAVSGLGDLVRRTLALQDAAAVTVDEEINLVRDVLAWQKLRFESRLDFDLSVDARALSARIPAMTIQLLVENAIRHGALAAGERERIAVRVRRHRGALGVDVENRLPSVPARRPGLGIGLTALRTRLDALGPGASLRRTTAFGHHRAHVLLPFATEVSS